MTPGKMTPGNLLTLAMLLVLASVSLTPVSASYSMYLKFGTHARQMQNWKESTANYLTSLEELANNVMSNIDAVNMTIQDAVVSTTKHVDGAERMAEEVNTRLDELTIDPSSIQDYEVPTAFQAYIAATGENLMATAFSTFKYTSISLNEGDAFSSVTGLFTAPVTGLYWFHATLTGESGKRETVIKKNKLDGTNEIIGYMNYYNDQETACTTVTVLYPGETVGVYPIVSAFESWDILGGPGNNFAGYLVARYNDPDFVPITPIPGLSSSTTF